VIFFLKNSSSIKILISALLLGYFIFGLYFTYHIHTHFYYQLQLILAISVALAASFDLVCTKLSNKKNFSFIIFILISIFIFYKNYYRSDSNFYKHNYIDGKVKSLQQLNNSIYLKEKYGNSDLIYYGKEGGTIMTYAGIKGARWIDIGALSGDIEAGVVSKFTTKEEYISRYWKIFNSNNNYTFFITDQPDVLKKDQEILYDFLMERCRLIEIDKIKNLLIFDIKICNSQVPIAK
jgi:hypothetical protein